MTIALSSGAGQRALEVPPALRESAARDWLARHLMQPVAVFQRRERG